MTYTTRRKVRFEHCDPAGIVFYPRYFEMINATVEDWFSDVVGCGFPELVASGRGVPVVALETQFLSPSRLGETLTFRLLPQAVGRTSLKLDITATGDDQPRLKVLLTLVLINLATGRPLPWPDAMRQEFLLNDT
ncbi:acyl-CoA thioesterase [Billgrantia diversa]|uniref:acyl-CoA thioesterase n=1 Tax=Halomonas sp. MCCC 1A13316 TaxID=2733487 RepID=UPI0018A5861C|nr:thioesterase family protein [Halomonas sp. MCCC 1A13316]QOR39200.1 acyl-CoA thioesterase [Halomonas sp. MCCC 1A13316]